MGLCQSLVLFVANMFHPVDNFSVEFFLDGDMRIAVVGAAPCQCFSPGENQTTSPGRISSMGRPTVARAHNQT